MSGIRGSSVCSGGHRFYNVVLIAVVGIANSTPFQMRTSP